MIFAPRSSSPSIYHLPLDIIKPDLKDLAVALTAISLELSYSDKNFGSAKEAKAPIKITTITNSTSVKPFLILSITFRPHII